MIQHVISPFVAVPVEGLTHVGRIMAPSSTKLLRALHAGNGTIVVMGLHVANNTLAIEREVWIAPANIAFEVPIGRTLGDLLGLVNLPDERGVAQVYVFDYPTPAITPPN